jgi:hypothetical protein
MSKENLTPYTSKTTGCFKVFVTSAYEDPWPLSAFLEFAKLDKVKNHQLVSDPAQADIILFIENARYHDDFFFRKLINHRLVKKYPTKVFMYNPHDLPWFVLPGLYPCIPRQQYDSSRVASSPYLEVVNEFITCDFSNPPKYLYSFFGAPSSNVRRKLFEIPPHPRSMMLASPQHIFFGKEKPKSPQVQYADLMGDSKFVLAPKGIGTSSLRLFEIMKAGRVPVIISDNFIFPSGPDWDNCSVKVSEADVLKIPSLLESLEDSWPGKSKAARKEWENFFAPDTIFNYFIDRLGELKQQGHSTARTGIHDSFAYWRYVNRKLVIEKVKKLVTAFV